MVDNVPYRIMGGVSSPNEITVPPQASVEFTPTRTTVISTAGPVDVNMSFWSPIEASFFYLCIESGWRSGGCHASGPRLVVTFVAAKSVQ